MARVPELGPCWRPREVYQDRASIGRPISIVLRGVLGLKNWPGLHHNTVANRRQLPLRLRWSLSITTCYFKDEGIYSSHRVSAVQAFYQQAISHFTSRYGD